MVRIIKSFLCHDIKQAMSYHIMEFYVTTCRISRLSQHPQCQPEVWCGSYDLVPETNDNNARLNLGAADS